MSQLKPILKILLKFWMKIVSLWNKAVISIFLFIIWFFILTPTALIKRAVQAIKNKNKKEPESFLKKSISLDSKHFTKPF